MTNPDLQLLSLYLDLAIARFFTICLQEPGHIPYTSNPHFLFEYHAWIFQYASAMVRSSYLLLLPSLMTPPHP